MSYDFDREQWRELIAKLQEKLPLAFPVKIHLTGKFKARYGDALLVRGKSRYFRIRITNSPDICQLAKEYILLHEWAHCRAWSHADDKQINIRDHGPIFGAAYSEVWEAYTS